MIFFYYKFFFFRDENIHQQIPQLIPHKSFHQQLGDGNKEQPWKDAKVTKTWTYLREILTVWV